MARLYLSSETHRCLYVSFVTTRQIQACCFPLFSVCGLLWQAKRVLEVATAVTQPREKH